MGETSFDVVVDYYGDRECETRRTGETRLKTQTIVNANANTTESFVALNLSAFADSDMAMEMVA
jgi:hypothetical protein